MPRDVESLTALNLALVMTLLLEIRNSPHKNLDLRLMQLRKEYDNEHEKYSIRSSWSSESEHSDMEAIFDKDDLKVVYPLSTEVAAMLGLDTNRTHGQSEKLPFQTHRVIRDLMKNGDGLSEPFLGSVGRKAVRVKGTNIVIKHLLISEVGATEVTNLQHIRKHSDSIPVPAPLGLISADVRGFLFTSYVPGVSLEKAWPDLSSSAKAAIRDQLSGIMLEVRRLPPTNEEHFLGGDDPPYCLRIGREFQRSATCLRTEAEYHDFVVQRSQACEAMVKHVRASLRDDHGLVMTHGDLTPRNILISGIDDAKVTGIIDWELGGYYPEYLEFVRSLDGILLGNRDECEDWPDYLPSSIGVYSQEFAQCSLLAKIVDF